MSSKPSRFVIPSGTNLQTDIDVLPHLPGRTFVNSKKPMWNTHTSPAISGRETRRQVWSYPKWAFEIQHDVIRNSTTIPELAKILAFFNSHAGSFQEFLYLDDEDNTAVDTPFGIGDGVTTEWALTRTLGSGNIAFVEPVRAFFGTPEIKMDGVVNAAFTVGDYGKITFTAPPANGKVLTWSGTFFFVCRFSDDELDFAQIVKQMWENGSTSFQSIKP